MPRMEINTRHQCDTCVEFWSADQGDLSGMTNGYHQVHINMSPEIWEAAGRPASFELKLDNVVSIDA